MSRQWNLRPGPTDESASRRRAAVSLAAGMSLVAASFVAPGVGAATAATSASASAGQASVVVRELEARLRGDAAGDPNGSGHVNFRLNRQAGRVCARVSFRRIANPNAAHIHRKSDGAIVVDLTGSVTGGANCRRAVPHRLIGRILAHPRRYYFNVHNTPFPAGAIRGTLHR